MTSVASVTLDELAPDHSEENKRAVASGVGRYDDQEVANAEPITLGQL